MVESHDRRVSEPEELARPRQAGPGCPRCSLGDGGRVPGTFYAVQGVATDSKGNLYTVETYDGKRVQKFTYKGVGTVTKAKQVIDEQGDGVFR